MPPCAETVCDLVGKTFETTAVLSPDFANSSDALIPEPPPPIIRASNSFVLISLKLIECILFVIFIIIYHYYLFPNYI